MAKGKSGKKCGRRRFQLPKSKRMALAAERAAEQAGPSAPAQSDPAPQQADAEEHDVLPSSIEGESVTANTDLDKVYGQTVLKDEGLPNEQLPSASQPASEPVTRRAAPTGPDEDGSGSPQSDSPVRGPTEEAEKSLPIPHVQ